MGRGWGTALSVGILLLAACGRAPTDEERQEFSPYLSRFAEVARRFGRQGDEAFPVLFGPTSPTSAGFCETGGFKSSRIVINRRVWDRLSEAGKEVLIFHELGHCILDRDHLDRSMNVYSVGGAALSVPYSMMHTSGVDGPTYLSWRQHYLEELFGEKGGG